MSSEQSQKPAPTAPKQLNNPLHGVKLQQIVEDLEAHFGFEELGQRIRIRCFTHDPSVKSSLKFLRKTPWAREKVEQLWLSINTDPWGQLK